MFDRYNTSGFDLYQPFDTINEWVFDPKTSQAYSGSLRDICKFMVEKLGFCLDDIEDGLNLLADNIKNDHSAIHFGAYKTCIFTFSYKEKYGKKAA